MLRLHKRKAQCAHGAAVGHAGNVSCSHALQVKWQVEGDEGSSCTWWGAELVEQRAWNAEQDGNMPAGEATSVVWTIR